jgi:hypothetical protein
MDLGDNVKRDLRDKDCGEMNENSAKSCLMAGFGLSGGELSGSTTRCSLDPL